MRTTRCTLGHRRTAFSLTAVAALTTLAIVLGAADAPTPPSAKEATLQRMHEIAEQVADLRAADASSNQSRNALRRLLKEYQTLSRSLGGDDPAGLAEGDHTQPAGGENRRGDEGGVAGAAAVPPGCASAQASFANTTPVVIPATFPSATIVSTLNVAGLNAFLWDVNLTTNLEHSNSPDLDITLTSPAGTVVTITTDNGLGANNFNGTLWDDSANPGGSVPYANNSGLVTDRTYSSGIAATTLVPEEALGAFFGENPNGVWTLKIVDDTPNGSDASLNGWSLDLTTTSSAPSTTTSSESNVIPVAIPTGPAVVGSVITISSAGMAITDVNLTTLITHTNNADLDITITSPLGTVVTLTSDNGGAFDDVFNGTIWDDDADPSSTLPYPSQPPFVNIATDRTYANGVVATTLVPEEALAAFIGEDPNGDWTLTISDDATVNSGGSLAAWSLSIETAATMPGTTTTNVSDIMPVTIDAPNMVASTILISGAGAYLWDVNAMTNIMHTFCSDLDITLTSPAGTIVTLTTDNGSSSDNVIAGTLWDDSVNPLGQVPYTSNNMLATDHAYVNNVTATPLAPEEALAAFIGENPNGLWTLTISDDTNNDGGTLSNWRLDITTLPNAPVSASPLHVANNTQQVISASMTSVTTSTLAVSGAGTALCDVDLNLNLPHTFPGDLDITLQSPAGTIVTITTDNGGGNDNVFAGTTFNDDANPGGAVPQVNNNGSVTDHLYANATLASPLTPEEPLGEFLGENPNGTWTLTISDDGTTDGGTLNSWSIDVVTCACSGSPPCPADINGDTQVDVTDLLAVITSWGPCASPPCAADIAPPGTPPGDGQINVNDLLMVITNWGACP